MKHLLGLTIIVFISIAAFCQQPVFLEFQFLSPLPGSKYVRPENNIAMRNGALIDKSSLQNFQIHVTGSEQGEISGKLILSTDGKTVIFKPSQPFLLGERVYVHSTGNIESIEGNKINPVNYWFDVVKKLPELPQNYFLEKDFEQSALLQNPFPLPRNKSISDNYLPEDFPEFSIEYSNQPNQTEYYFVSPFGYWGWFPDNVPYLIIFDSYGTPVFYEKLTSHPYDFKLQENGMLSFYYNLWPDAMNVVYDDAFNQVDTYVMGNGYGTPDFHEFLLLENGHAIVMSYDAQIVDMSEVVPGGNPEAIVSGWIIQEMDTEKNVIFQWSSWDHLEITDCDEHVDLTADIIDPIHGNSVEVWDDALLLSPRNFNEITKIDRNTGDIIWRLGGKNNMFNFVNDTLRFSRAHDARVLDNGNISLFDNGTYHPDPQFSSMIEYEVDDENMEVSLIRRLRTDPDILGIIMGNAQETSDKDIIVGWGSGVPGLTEFNQDNERTLEVYFAGINYRAFRFPFSTSYFSCSTDTLHYGYMWYQETRTKTFKVINHQDEPIEITSYHTNTDYFTLQTELPITIPAGGETTFSVVLVPDAAGTFEDVLTLNSDINSDNLVRRIAQQIKLIGYATEGQSVDDYNQSGVFVTPNPAENFISVSSVNNELIEEISIYNTLGSLEFFQKLNAVDHLTIDISPLSEGIHIIKYKTPDNAKSFQIRFIKK